MGQTVVKNDYLRKMKRSFIITAGGSGTRMGNAIPKQFLLLDGKPLIMHTIERLHAFDHVAELVVALPEQHIAYWQELTDKYDFDIIHKIVEGGTERFFSIKNALSFCTGDMVAVHDAVRPFVSTETLVRLFKDTSKDAVIPVMPVSESLREVNGDSTHAVIRSNYVTVQTPQVFKRRILEEAYEQDYSSKFTDDASVVESLGYSISTVEGNVENIKITTPLDLILAEAMVKQS